jgi:hypothetical protein
VRLGAGLLTAASDAKRPILRTGSGFHPAMVRAHARASASSVTLGNSRRSSTAAANSPPCSKAVRIAAASASVTVNMSGSGQQVEHRAVVPRSAACGTRAAIAALL